MVLILLQLGLLVIIEGIFIKHCRLQGPYPVSGIEAQASLAIIK